MTQYILIHTAQDDPSVESEVELKSLLESHHAHVLTQFPGVWVVEGQGEVLQDLIRPLSHWRLSPAASIGFAHLR